MINIHIYKKTYLTPESWDELTGKQVISIAAIINKPEKTFKDKVYLLKVCLGMSAMSFISYGYLPTWQNDKLFWKKLEVLLFIERSLYLIDFLLNANELTKQLLPTLQLRGRKFYGPVENFENLRMHEFCWAEYWYLRYKDTPALKGEERKEALVNLVATLYRPARKNYDIKKDAEGDVRLPFNVHLTKIYAKKLRKINVNVLQAVVIWYEGCRFNLVKSFTEVFKGKSTDTESFGLFSLITGVAEDGVMGDFDKVNNKHVQVILLRLTELIIRAEKLEADLKAQTPN